MPVLAEVAGVVVVALVAASAPEAGVAAVEAVEVVVAVGVAVGAEAVVALERSNMPTRHISMPQSLNRSRLQ